MSNKNRIWCVLIVVFLLLVAGISLCFMKAGAEAEKEKGYLIRQMEEKENVGRA